MCTPENEHLFYQLATNAAYNLLGERSYGTDVSWIQVANLSSADPADIEKLEALPECIGMRRSGIVVDGEGNLVSVS